MSAQTYDASHTNGGTHVSSSRAGAANEYVKHVAGRHEDPDFSGEPVVDAEETQRPVRQQLNGVGSGPRVPTTDEVEIICGPLLNYKRMSGEHTDEPRWHGSVLIVTAAGNVPRDLTLKCLGPSRSSNGLSLHHDTLQCAFAGEKLYEDPAKAFWRFVIDAPFQKKESVWEYSIPKVRHTKGDHLAKPQRFAIPSKHESMRIMFHSCNGFSPGTDEEAWSGPALWSDVLRMHEKQPFHVMIGGGDQIYNDGVRITGPLKPWSAIANPKKRRDFPFNEDLRAQCDDFYYDNYVRWYGTEPFASANGQIPQVNIWDDHDIIDGFGSYTDNFMKCAVFRGIGGVAHKYYLLFQHHIPPPPSTFTTDAPQTTHTTGETTARDAVQLKDSFVMTPTYEDPSFIIGQKPGPYVEERSRSIYCQLGKRIALLGIDARTERTRHQVNYPETYDSIFARANEELSKSRGEIKHLILLLGIPIAYPRLQWLENALRSPLIAPMRFLNKRFGLAGGFFNHFDGSVDILDDLDDHYTTHEHKKERKDLMMRLQALAKRFSVRVTILGGDVHLAALGRFYSNPALDMPVERDWRYMVNIVSSAITNKPPPHAVANLLAKRNKIHHLDRDTDETLLELFDRDPGEGQPGVTPKTAAHNHATMPSRNYAIITESHDHGSDHDDGPQQQQRQQHDGTTPANGHLEAHQPPAAPPPSSHHHHHQQVDPHKPLHAGEAGAGTTHAAAQGVRKTGLAGLDGLDVTIRVEISPSDRAGRTEGYGLSIPALDARGYEGQGVKW